MSKSNQRAVYGQTLLELGRENSRIVALEADLGKTTMSGVFGAEFPERYFQMGIAEQNMAGFAAGLAIEGKIPFIHSFSVFSSARPYEQLRQSVCWPGLPVKIIGVSAGLSDFMDGATHQSIDDLALMNVLPNMTVLAPCDGLEMAMAVRTAADISGPVYIRVCRNDIDDIYPSDHYEPDEPVILKDGGDVCVFSTGVMAREALKAAGSLESEGISARVIHLPGTKPLNEKKVIAAAEGASAIVTCEEHSVYGGLGMILCRVFRNDPRPKELVAIQDRFGQSALSWEELLDHYHISADYIHAAARKALNL